MFTGIKTDGENRDRANALVQRRHFILALVLHKTTKKKFFEFKKLIVD